MPDFHQTKTITTLHQLCESEINILNHSEPHILVLPINAKDLILPSVSQIVVTLTECIWLDIVIICLDHSTKSYLRLAREIFNPIGPRLSMIDSSGIKVQNFFKRLTSMGYPGYKVGKGSNLAAGFWYVVSRFKNGIVIVQDIDISREVYSIRMLERLAMPLLPRHSTLDVCKAYYPRIHKKRFKGRLTRLLILPLLTVLEDILPKNKFIKFLTEFRYLLSGEIAMRVPLLSRIRLSQNWSFDIRLLRELWVRGFSNRIAQSPVVPYYDHKHTSFRADLNSSTSKGLCGMASDICIALWDMLSEDGTTINKILIEEICNLYGTESGEYIQRYAQDARFNNLIYRPTQERHISEVFRRVIKQSGLDYIMGKRDIVLPSYDELIFQDQALIQPILDFVEQ